MCGGGPPPGTSCDSTTLTTPPVSRPWMRMTIGMPRTLTLLPPSERVWMGVIVIAGNVLSQCADWQENNRRGSLRRTVEELRGRRQRVYKRVGIEVRLQRETEHDVGVDRAAAIGLALGRRKDKGVALAVLERWQNCPRAPFWVVRQKAR